MLHAPLELAARVALLPSVHPAAREAARLRIFAVADQYEAFGPPVATPTAARFDSVADGAARLLAAIEWGELDDVDEAAAWLGRAASPIELQRALTDAVTPRLAAAAHAPIFLYQLPRVAPRGELTGELLRGLAASWRVHRSGGCTGSTDATPVTGRSRRATSSSTPSPRRPVVRTPGPRRSSTR